jgi:hypothetical protein
MPISIPAAYIETFEQNVRHLAQQKPSRLRQYVTEINKQSQTHNWDRLAASASRKKTSARMVSPGGGSGSGAVGSTDGLDWTRRNTVIQVYDTGEVVESEDITQMLIDPKSSVTENLAMNMRRRVDDILIDGANKPAPDGAGGTVAFPAGQILGGATEIISLDHILQIQELFGQNDIDPDEPKVLVIGPTQQRKLMQLVEVTSGDFQAVKALSTGYLPNWLGFDWVVSTRLNAPDDAQAWEPAAGQIYCLAFTKKALGFHVAKDISAQVAQRPDMSFAWQLYCELHMDASRVEDEHIVRLHLKDALV